MLRVLIVFGFLFIGSGLGAQDHQRVALSSPAVHRFEAALDGSFSPLGYAQWNLALAPRIGYEWQKTWSASLTLPYSWRSEPEARTVAGVPGDAAVGLNWAGGSNDLHWRLGCEGTVPLDPGAGSGRTASFDLSIQVVRDPVILGAIAGLTLAEEEGGSSVQGTFFFQEVVNDSLTWSLVLSPRCAWYQGLPLWTLSVAWKVGWYEGGSSVTSGLSTGSGAPWTWLASGAQTWDFP